MKFVVQTAIIFLLFVHCNQSVDTTISLAGNAQGTTFQVRYISPSGTNYREAIDSIFRRIDSALSTYVPASIISRMNKNDTAVEADDHFIHVFNSAQAIAEKTGGVFDITVAPVINAWGFGFTKKAAVDSAMIDSLLSLVGYKMVTLNGRKLVKKKPQVMMDFNAIAQGYTVDVIAAFLESKDITGYMIELGGEVRARGKKENGQYWSIGIDQPNETPVDGRPLEAIIRLNDRALATSGNYRKFYMENGEKRAHIIDPHTGYPAKHSLLSATVLANDCTTADAYATVFMVMGPERSKQFVADHPELKLDVFFIYDENGAWKTYTSGMLKEWIQEMPGNK